MDWFEKLVGFRETSFYETRSKLALEGGRLVSLVNGASYATGELELASLDSLRRRASSGGPSGRLQVSVVTGDVRHMHRSPDNAGAMFQVASQFNMLEMVSPDVTPEHGVTRYQNDRTQGPACAIAAGAATIFRNYLVPIGQERGQTADRQLDGLADMGNLLSSALKRPINELWIMRNGYALATRAALDAITTYLASSGSAALDTVRGTLRIGIHRDVEATEATGPDRPLLTQAFCSALPVAYSDIGSSHWEAFASVVLEAAYEATLWAAVLNAQRGASRVVFLTFLGGGAFGNDEAWILAAIRRALDTARSFDLDVRLVSYAAPSRAILRLVSEFQ